MKDMVTGAVALAIAHVIAASTRSTWPCTPTTAEGQAGTYVAAGDLGGAGGRRQNPLFQSHMWDGSAVPIDENSKSRRSCSKWPRPPRSSWRSRSVSWAARRTGRGRDQRQALHHSGGFEKTIEPGHGEHGQYLLAATFGNVHGVYKPAT